MHDRGRDHFRERSIGENEGVVEFAGAERGHIPPESTRDKPHPDTVKVINNDALVTPFNVYFDESEVFLHSA
jgi:hypothetical protein